jgi:hypothetical protein
MDIFDIIVRISNVGDRSGERLMSVSDQRDACTNAIKDHRQGRVGEVY